MSDIATYLNNILTAIRGEDVRQSIHDAIQACYEDGQSGATDLTARQMVQELQTRINNQYPVGSIFISTSSANPSEALGGTWVRVAQGRTLIGAGSIVENTTADHGTVTAGQINPTAGTRGGEVTHTLNTNEMPSHAHGLGYGANTTSGTAAIPVFSSTLTSANTTYTGANQPHNNMMPYLVVYIWERTA